MSRIRIMTENGEILLLSEPGIIERDGEKHNLTVIPPEQVDGIIKWLLEAKDELLGK